MKKLTEYINEDFKLKKKGNISSSSLLDSITKEIYNYWGIEKENPEITKVIEEWISNNNVDEITCVVPSLIKEKLMANPEHYSMSVDFINKMDSSREAFIKCNRELKIISNKLPVWRDTTSGKIFTIRESENILTYFTANIPTTIYIAKNDWLFKK